MVTLNVALAAPGETVTLEGTTAVVLLLDSAIWAPPEGAGPLSVTVPVDDCAPPVTLVGFRLSEERMGAGAGCSNTHTAGFASLIGTITNFDGETTYAMALPPGPELRATVPLPFVEDDETE